MSDRPQNPNDRVTDLLLDAVLDPGVNSGTLEAELREAGVDIDGIQRRAAQMIGQAVRDHCRQAAAEASATRAAELAAARQRFASQSIAQVRAWLRSVAEGAFGPALQALAQPCFRNRKSEEMTEEELRDLMAEIQVALSDRSQSEPSPTEDS